MHFSSQTRCTSFEGLRQIATGALRDVVIQTKEVLDRGERGSVLIFDDESSQTIEIDFRGTLRDVLKRLDDLQEHSNENSTDGVAISADAPKSRGPGRPKLGVVAREVTLMPRHWDWLNSQPGGASVALRKLVEDARRGNESRDKLRARQEATYRFLSAIAGNLPGYEEVLRALFAPDRPRFQQLIEPWPADIRQHAAKLAVGAFQHP